MKKQYLFLPVLLTLITGSLYALKKDEVTFTRNFTLNHVDISIISEGMIENIVPDTTYEYPIQIENKGEPCYVRILDDNDSIKVDTNWIKVGNYYYYPESIDTNELIDYSSHVLIGDLQEDQEKLDWHIQAEAIQSKNFTLDLSLNDPFQQVEIISFEKDGENA